jgi:hypothetical protein
MMSVHVVVRVTTDVSTGGSAGGSPARPPEPGSVRTNGPLDTRAGFGFNACPLKFAHPECTTMRNNA